MSVLRKSIVGIAAAVIVVVIVAAALFVTMGSDDEDKTAPPGVPANLELQAGDDEVHLTWDAPGSNGTSPLLFYTVYLFSSNGTDDYLLKQETGNDTLTWSGLEGETTYYFAVSATSDDGEGEMTDLEPVTTLEVVEVPNASDLVLDAGAVGTEYSIVSTTAVRPSELVPLGLRSYVQREFTNDPDSMDADSVMIEICVCATEDEAHDLMAYLFSESYVSENASDYSSMDMGNESLSYREYLMPGILIDGWVRYGSIVVHIEFESPVNSIGMSGWYEELMTAQMEKLYTPVNVGVF